MCSLLAKSQQTEFGDSALFFQPPLFNLQAKSQQTNFGDFMKVFLRSHVERAYNCNGSNTGTEPVIWCGRLRRPQWKYDQPQFTSTQYERIRIELQKS